MKKILLRVVLLVMFIHFSGLVYSAIPSSERAALIDLDNSTNGDSWTNNNGWKTPPLDVDGFAMSGTKNTWFGIIVSADRVTEINLYSNQLFGSIPTELENLANLQSLYLFNNQLSGPIPIALGKLTNLKNLYLYNNQLSGSIPAALGNLANLEILWLHNNQLSGSIPAELGNLTNLKNLYLYNNQLSGPIPTELENLVNLRYLWLNNNLLTGPIPAELENLTNLWGLNLHNNQLSGSIPAQLENLANLLYLDLGYNRLSGSIPTALGNLSILEGLYLDWNQLTGPIPAALGNLTNLQFLYLSDNQLSGSIPAALGNLKYLRELRLNGNQLTGSIPASLNTLSDLDDGGSDFRWNGLYTDNDALRTFLNNKQLGVYWETTQTVAPENLSCGSPTNTSLTVSWTPIIYTANTGGYRVFYSTTSGGPYTAFGMTADKTEKSLKVTGLTTGTTYYFVVETQTNPHAQNNNTVVSEQSEEISCLTGSPEIYVCPWKKDFGMVNSNCSETFTFTVFNYGNLDLEVKKTLLYGPDAEEFSKVSGDGSYTLAPGNQRNLIVSFHPTSAGKKSATIGIESNDPDKWTTYIPLEGTGIELDVVPPIIVYCLPPPGSVAIHKNSDLQFTITDSSGTGVDSASITVVINDSIIVSQGADQTGGRADIISHSPCYTIHYDPAADFASDSVITVKVEATDLAGTPNSLDTTYTFTAGSSRVTAIAADSVDQSGGSVCCDTSEVSVTIPAGALDMEAEIEIGMIDNPPPLPDSVSSIGLTYHFGPAGLHFADSVTLTIPYTQHMLDAAGVTDPEDLPVYYFVTSTGEWIRLIIVGHDNTCIQVKVKEFCYLLTGKTRTETEVKETEEKIPHGFALHQNHPNPFNPETKITYTLPTSAQVTITVYNMIGQPVRTLVDTHMPAGSHQVIWNARNDRGKIVPSGIYMYILKSGSYTEMRKALLMK